MRPGAEDCRVDPGHFSHDLEPGAQHPQAGQPGPAAELHRVLSFLERVVCGPTREAHDRLLELGRLGRRCLVLVVIVAVVVKVPWSALVDLLSAVLSGLPLLT